MLFRILHRAFLFRLKLIGCTRDLHYLMLCVIYLDEQTYSRNIICIITISYYIAL